MILFLRSFKSVPACQFVRFALRHDPLESERVPETDGFGKPEEQFATVAAIAERVGKEIASTFRSLASYQRRGIVTALRRQITPPGMPVGEGARESRQPTQLMAALRSNLPPQSPAESVCRPE